MPTAGRPAADRGLRLRASAGSPCLPSSAGASRTSRRSTSATTRGRRTVRARPTRSAASPLEAVEWLLAQDVKLLVLACNTGHRACPRRRPRARRAVPVLGVVRPGAVAAAAATRSRQVGVIATAGTVESGAYPAAIVEADPATHVAQLACPELVPMVEAGILDGPARRVGPARLPRAAAGRRPRDGHAPARLHPLPAAAGADRGGSSGRAWRWSTRPSRRPSRSRTCSTRSARGRRRRHAGHRVATTGDVEAFVDGRRAPLRRAAPRGRIGRDRAGRAASPRLTPWHDTPGSSAPGIVVGGLLALGASVASREIMRRAGTRLLDWEAVREIAHRRLGDAAAPIPAAYRAEAEAFYRATLLRIEPIVAEEIGSPLPQPRSRRRRSWTAPVGRPQRRDLPRSCSSGSSARCSRRRRARHRRRARSRAG